MVQESGNQEVTLHARVTVGIKVSRKEADLVVALANGSIAEEDRSKAEAVLGRFTEGADAMGYESGYVPSEWLNEDTGSEITGTDGIDL